MKRFLLGTTLVASLAAASTAHTQVLLAEFSEQSYPTNPMNGYGGFTFGDFSVGGAVTATSDSLVLDVAVDNDGVNGKFGGVGVDFGTPAEIAPSVFVLQPIDFDSDVAWWEMRVKLLESNESTTVNAVYRDSDSPDNADQEEYQFNFDLSSIPDDAQFHVITVPANDFGSSSPSTGTPDGMNNPGLNQIQIQSVFGSDLRTHIEVDYVRIYTVPEPTGLTLMGLCLAEVVLVWRKSLKIC
ncbi:HORMA domain-containing protein [Aeoliella sp. ICT_H6.2]|uniref:HORMA domain-containing protein n=1 Tax=Aeoliella straminimaris TaxID=2954799 RepID=A0A9X2FIS0_9BACT|nr:HORMA domain-containing protein [Aeoliella straminimaris]MCO6047481.1 HORMA domain-containing protein [Aeoliella straminimaris]